jgi:hypothetical protein
MAVVNVRGTEYSIADNLVKKWDKIKDGKLAKLDEDRFYIVDGEERSGKSLFTIQQAAYIDETILDDEEDKVLPRICFSTKEFLWAVRNTRSTNNQTKVVIFDEAFRGLSTKSALSKINKELVQALMEAGQNNLVVFIVSPTYFLIEFYVAVLRTKALFHVVKEKNSKLRFVRIFGKKTKGFMYQSGLKKGWSYNKRTKHRVRFYNKYPMGDDFEKRYRLKKRKSIIDENPEEPYEHRWKKQRDGTIKALYASGKPVKEIVKLLKEYGEPLDENLIWDILKKKNEKGETFRQMLKNRQKPVESEEIAVDCKQ